MIKQFKISIEEIKRLAKSMVVLVESGAKKRSYIGLPNKAEYSLSGYKT